MDTAVDIINRFCSITTPCKSWNSYDDICIIGDHQVRYKTEIEPKANACAFDVDGGLIKDVDVQKCDKILLVERPKDLFCHARFIEMKSGKDIKQAISQLTSTLNHSLFNTCRFYERECVIVCGKSLPKKKPGGEWARAQKRFKEKNRCNIRTVRNGQFDEKLIV